MRTRQAHMTRGYLQAVSEGLSGKDALLRGGRLAGIGGCNNLGDLVVVGKMEAHLMLPDVKQAIRNVYGEVGFSLDEAVQIHIGHIKGSFTDKDGDPIPPSYAALKDYLKAVTPQEPRRFDVRTQRVNPERESRTDGSAPKMASRAVGFETIEHEG